VELSELKQLRAENASLKTQLETVRQHSAIIERESAALYIIKKIVYRDACRYSRSLPNDPYTGVKFVLDALADCDRNKIFNLLEEFQIPIDGDAVARRYAMIEEIYIDEDD
jgi:hypothetical protein